jgi:hypothetical protein
MLYITACINMSFYDLIYVKKNVYHLIVRLLSSSSVVSCNLLKSPWTISFLAAIRLS